MSISAFWKDEYLKWVSGFANAQGGKIYIGIDDDLTVVGVENLHKQLEDIPNKIINNTGVFPETNHLSVDGKDVIEIVIEPCGMPISYRGVYFYRSGATKQEFRGAALHQFLLKKMGLNWEDIPCDGITLDDIDDGAIEYFLDHAIGEGRMDPESRKSSKEDVLYNLGLIKDGIPTNGAVLLFGKYPQRRFVTSSFKIEPKPNQNRYSTDTNRTNYPEKFRERFKENTLQNSLRDEGESVSDY